jgi:hypothetical protein
MVSRAIQEMAGGSHLLILIISVDVVLGPLLTFVVFNTQSHAVDTS